MALNALKPDHYPFFDYRRFTFSLGIEVPEGIWLSGSTAVRHDPEQKAMVLDGDLLDQADVIFEKMRCALKPAGRSLRDLTRLARYVTPAAIPDLARLDAHQAHLLGSPGTSTTVVSRLLRDSAMIEMDASIATGQESLSLIFPDPSDDTVAAVSGSLAGRRVQRLAQFYSPGHAPLADLPGLAVATPCLPDGAGGLQIEAILAAPRTGIVHVVATGDGNVGGIVAQCRDAYRRIATSLEEAGTALDRVIKTTEFVAPAGLADYRETAAVRREVFAAPFPAATGVVCSGFPDDATLIAIEATARLEAAG